MTNGIYNNITVYNYKRKIQKLFSCRLFILQFLQIGQFTANGFGVTCD